MDIKMNYFQGTDYMKEMCKQGSGVFVPESQYPELTITYPGYKKNGDYRLKISSLSSPPTHFDICKFLNYKVKTGAYDYDETVKLLEDIYYNGTNINLDSYKINNIKNLVALIYWITLQDEINYPQPQYQGRRMPFSRYFEAIHCAKFCCGFTMQEVENRCFNRGNRPTRIHIENAPSFYI